MNKHTMAEILISYILKEEDGFNTLSIKIKSTSINESSSTYSFVYKFNSDRNIDNKHFTLCLCQSIEDFNKLYQPAPTNLTKAFQEKEEERIEEREILIEIAKEISKINKLKQ